MKKILKLLFDEYALLTIPTVYYTIRSIVDIIVAGINNNQQALQANITILYIHVFFWIIGAMIYAQKSTNHLRFGITRREKHQRFLISVLVLNLFILLTYTLISLSAFLLIKDKSNVTIIDYFYQLPAFFVILNGVLLSLYYGISRLFKNYDGYKMSSIAVTFLLALLGLVIGFLTVGLTETYHLDKQMTWWMITIMMCYIGGLIYLILQTRLKKVVIK